MRSPRSSRLSGSQDVWSKNNMRRSAECVWIENGKLSGGAMDPLSPNSALRSESLIPPNQLRIRVAKLRSPSAVARMRSRDWPLAAAARAVKDRCSKRGIRY